eukprot:SAG31_NODE_97_length_25714_cov_19.477142_16_plen_172_part_00
MLSRADRGTSDQSDVSPKRKSSPHTFSEGKHGPVGSGRRDCVSRYEHAYIYLADSVAILNGLPSCLYTMLTNQPRLCSKGLTAPNVHVHGAKQHKEPASDVPVILNATSTDKTASAEDECPKIGTSQNSNSILSLLSSVFVLDRVMGRRDANRNRVASKAAAELTTQIARC